MTMATQQVINISRQLQHCEEEEKIIAWSIKEAIFISANGPSINKNTAKYQLPQIWDKVLVITPELG